MLFAVNVTAVLPLTPSNLGVFQAACVAVLTGAYGVSAADALGYGIILQAVEIATAVVMGAPALVKEGLSWRESACAPCTRAPVDAARRARGRAGRGARLAPATEDRAGAVELGVRRRDQRLRLRGAARARFSGLASSRSSRGQRRARSCRRT